MNNLRFGLVLIVIVVLTSGTRSFAQLDDTDVDGLTLKEVSPHVVHLSWKATAAVPCVNTVSYSVFRDTDEEFVPSTQNLLVSKIIVTQYIAHEPNTSKTYYYHVRAFRSATRCSSNADNAARPQDNDTTKDKLASLEKRVADLENTLTYYKYLIDQKQVKTSSIQLDPSDHNFQRLDSDTSTFLVSVTDASPYLDGYRLKLDIGNPSDAKFSNVTVKVRWSRSYDWSTYTADSYKKWENAIHEKAVTVTSDLLPGTWNSVDVDLVPAASNELKFLELSIDSPTVSLHTK